MIISLYETLEISELATEEDVRMAYRRLAMRWHPDRNQNDLDTAEVRFKQIAYAYAILSDVDKRKQYDRSIAQEAAEKSAKSYPYRANTRDMHRSTRERVNVDFDLAEAVENFVDAMFKLSRSMANSKHGEHAHTVLFEMLISYGCPTDMSAKLTAIIADDTRILGQMKQTKIGVSQEDMPIRPPRKRAQKDLVLSLIMMAFGMAGIYLIYYVISV